MVSHIKERTTQSKEAQRTERTSHRNWLHPQYMWYDMEYVLMKYSDDWWHAVVNWIHLTWWLRFNFIIDETPLFFILVDFVPLVSVWCHFLSFSSRNIVVFDRDPLFLMFNCTKNICTLVWVKRRFMICFHELRRVRSHFYELS